MMAMQHKTENWNQRANRGTVPAVKYTLSTAVRMVHCRATVSAEARNGVVDTKPRAARRDVDFTKEVQCVLTNRHT